MSQTLSLLPCGLWRSRSTRGWGKCMRDQGGSFFVRSNTASNFFGLSVRLDVFPLALFTQTPDSELDVIDGGLWTIPAHESGNSRIRRSRAATLSFSLLHDSARSLRRGRMMSRIQTRNAACGSGLAALHERGKRSQPMFFSTHLPGEGSKSTARAAYIRNLKASQRRNSSIGITICRIAREKTKHTAKTTRQAYSTSILKLLFSGQGTKPSTV
jgi:hypothetical protein